MKKGSAKLVQYSHRKRVPAFNWKLVGTRVPTRFELKAGSRFHSFLMQFWCNLFIFISTFDVKLIVLTCWMAIHRIFSWYEYSKLLYFRIIFIYGKFICNIELKIIMKIVWKKSLSTWKTFKFNKIQIKSGTLVVVYYSSPPKLKRETGTRVVLPSLI